jgi:hypothetical protein
LANKPFRPPSAYKHGGFSIALEERLDAMVDRAMRRLAQMKFMKQISGSSERQLKNVTALQIEGPQKPKQKNKK